MKKLVTLALGLSFVLGTATMFAQEAPKEAPKAEKKKKSSKKKAEKKKAEAPK